VLVTFTVNMAGAVDTQGHAFDPANDNVYVNGQFAGWYPWAGTFPGPAPAGYQMIEEGFSSIYTNAVIFPVGTPVDCAYKYGMDINTVFGGPQDDEAPFLQNHVRVIRSLSTGAYVLPTDTFGNQYVEPSFGQLALAPGAPGTVQLSWLGAPNVQVQTSSNLTGGAWTSVSGTSGAYWSAGTNSPNGLVSVTNWPAASGGTYFRLIKQ
jgi:hypothetical protein